MFATIRDDTWNMLNMQHITPNSKRWDYSDTPGGEHKKIKGSVYMVEGGHHLTSCLWMGAGGFCKVVATRFNHVDGWFRLIPIWWVNTMVSYVSESFVSRLSCIQIKIWSSRWRCFVGFWCDVCVSKFNVESSSITSIPLLAKCCPWNVVRITPN